MNHRTIESLVLVFGLFLSACANTTAPTTNTAKLSGTLYYNKYAEIHKIALQSGEVPQLGPTPDPNVFPDGRFVSVAGDGLIISSASGVQQQMVVRENHDVPFDITFDDFFHNPRLSPDGQSIAYDDGQQGVCHVVELQGTLLWTIGNESFGSIEHYERPVWGKDGSLFVQGEFSNGGIYKIAKDFLSSIRIDPDLGSPSKPAVSPDGATVAFVANGDIWLMGNDGSNPRQLTTGNRSADYPTWSPDGKWIACYGPTHDILFVAVADGSIHLSSVEVPNLNRDQAIGGHQMDWK